MLRKGDEPIPGYRLAHFLGRGAFGEVWRASAPGGTSAALKFIDLNGKQGLKEYRAVQRVKEVRHAHLLPIYAFWMVDQYGDVLSDTELEAWDLSGSVMPTQVKPELLHVEARPPATLVVAMLLGDKSLSERLDECRGPKGEPRGIAIDELLDYMEDAAKGIDFLNSPRHDLGDGSVALQHCDIKPQNLLLVGNSVLVCDFGLARVLGDDQRTKTAMAGSPAYMAPEVIRNRKPSHQTDQYALAITYFELRTGKLPFDHESYAAVLDAHLRGKLDWSRLSPPEQTIIAKATALEPANRFATSLELVRALRRAVGEDSGIVTAGRSVGSPMPASPVASSVASPGTSQSGSRGGSQSPRDLGTGDSDAMTDDANEPPDDADARNAGRRAAADGALADFGTRDTALVTQSTVDSTASDDEEQQTTDQAAAAEPTPSDEPPAPKPATADAADERPARRRPAREAPRAAAPAAKRHGLSLVLWLAVAGGLAFAAWKYWPDMSGSQRTKSSGPTATPNSPTKSGNDSGGGASGSSGEPTNGKTDDRRPPVVHTKESLRLQFAPADSRVTIDGVAAALDASGALQLERLPNEPIAIAARRDGFRDFAATKTLAEWRAAGGAIRLEPLPVDYAAQGRDLLAKGRTPQAIEFLEQAIAAGHGSPPVYHALGLARQQLGDDPSAVDAFSKAIADDAGLADAFRARAASYRTMKKWTEAIADLERYVELAPAKIALVADDRVDALAGRIYESLAANRVDEALRDTAAAIDVAAERPRAKVTALLARGAVRRQSGRLDDAVDDFRAAVKLDADLARRVKPALAEALLVRGNLRNETAQQTLAQAKSPPTPEVLKLFDPAIADLTESITLAPGDEAYSARGFAYNARGEFEKAVADFSEALKSNPTSVLALNNRGYAYFLLKEYKEAVDDLSAAIRLTMTDNPLAYSNRGAAYYQLREYDKAVSDYTEALRQSREPSPQLKIGLAQAFYARGEGFAKSGNFDSALGDFQKALEHAADAPKLLAELRQREADTLSRLATARVQQGRVGDALDLAQQYVTRYSKVADAYATRGYVHSARREFKKSIADYDKAIEIDRKNPKHYYYRGLVNAAAGDNAAAIDDYTAAITLDANLAEAYIRRAAAYDLRKSPGDAARSAADRRKAALLATPIPPVAPPAP